MNNSLKKQQNRLPISAEDNNLPDYAKRTTK